MLISSLLVRAAKVTEMPHVRLTLIVTECEILGVTAKAKAQGVLKDTDGMPSWKVLISSEGATNSGMNQSYCILFPF